MVYLPNIPFHESPNHSVRKSPHLDMIVIHATGGSFDSALSWMTNPKSGVSSHYLIGKDGNVVQLVKDADKAWHAGKSSWEGRENVNEFSLGIELENQNNGSDVYTPNQIRALIYLCSDLMQMYRIPSDRVVGHDQVAPGRKTDPNVNFPWVTFGIGLGACLGEVVDG